MSLVGHSLWESKQGHFNATLLVQCAGLLCSFAPPKLTAALWQHSQNRNAAVNIVWPKNKCQTKHIEVETNQSWVKEGVLNVQNAALQEDGNL